MTAAPPPAHDPALAYRQALQADVAEWMPQGMAATLARLQRARDAAPTAAERGDCVELLAAATTQHGAWASRLAAALQQAAEQDLAGTPAARSPAAAAPAPLSLLDEDSIDEDIAVSRLVQIAETDAEALLRELAPLCSRLRGHDAVSPDANPLRPALVAGALRRAAGGFGLPRPQRLLLLREAGIGLGGELKALYGRQLERLQGWGVEPTRFALKLSLSPRRVDGAAAPASPASVKDALQRLDVGAEPPTEVMTKLLSLLLSRATLNDGTREMIRRLDEPARRIARQDPALWQSPEHPLWQLLDRLVAAGSVHEEMDTTRPGAVGAALERAVVGLEAAEQPDAAQCRAALAAVDFAVTDLLGEQAGQLAPQARALQDQLARADIEARLREQVVQQVRGTTAPPALRQFLGGPGAAALAHSAHRDGPDGAQLKMQADLVDDMIAACARPAGTPLATERRVRLLTHARLGLAAAGFPANRIDAEVADLERVLRRPPAAPAPAAAPVPAAEPVAEALIFAATGVDEQLAGLGLHEALPTVPIDTFEPSAHAPPTTAALSSGAWIERLEPGACCRMFLLERWMNTQLVWRSAQRSMFVFSSRHGGRTHSLSRRSLEKLRAAGLATTIERGDFVAQALADLAGSPGR